MAATLNSTISKLNGINNLMKVLLYGHFGKYPKELESKIKSIGLEIVSKNPQVILTYGGDGTFLGAERDYPEVPKLYLKNSGTCFHCNPLSNDKLLELLVEGKLKTQEIMKLETRYREKTYTALNEILIAHKFPNTAIRFHISSQPFNLSTFPPLYLSTSPPNELVGDGVLAATPFGATGYFYSITKTAFQKGIGLAFNNLHNSNLVKEITDENSEIKIEITRGPAILAYDNDTRLIDLKENTPILIKKSPQTAKMLIP